jgi:hypothetical protein
VGNADPNLFARRPAKKAAKKAPAKPAPEQVFLNIPYDAKVERLYSAYILGVIELGLKPRATLAIPGGIARLDRIISHSPICNETIQPSAVSVLLTKGH